MRVAAAASTTAGACSAVASEARPRDLELAPARRCCVTTLLGGCLRSGPRQTDAYLGPGLSTRARRRRGSAALGLAQASRGARAFRAWRAACPGLARGRGWLVGAVLLLGRRSGFGPSVFRSLYRWWPASCRSARASWPAPLWARSSTRPRSPTASCPACECCSLPRRWRPRRGHARRQHRAQLPRPWRASAALGGALAGLACCCRGCSNTWATYGHRARALVAALAVSALELRDGASLRPSPPARALPRRAGVGACRRGRRGDLAQTPSSCSSRSSCA